MAKVYLLGENESNEDRRHEFVCKKRYAFLHISPDSFSYSAFTFHSLGQHLGNVSPLHAEVHGSCFHFAFGSEL